MIDTRPLILTLAFDPASFERFNQLRRRHFPAALNVIPAHLTLFHKLPGERLEEIARTIEAVAGRTPEFDLEVTGLRSLGRGVALEIASPALAAVRGELARAFANELTPQDRQGFRPHVTIQNKVAPHEAEALLEQLSTGFEPWTAGAEGLSLWRYLGGPWALERAFGFTRAA